MISLNLRVAHLSQRGAHVFIPNVAALLGAINCPIQLQDYTFRDVHARWGLHVDFLLELPIEVGSLDVHLVDGEVLLNSDGKDSAECGEFDDWGERLVIVEAFDLSEALSHNAGLVLLYTAVWTTVTILGLVGPLFFISLTPSFLINPSRPPSLLIPTDPYLFTALIR